MGKNMIPILGMTWANGAYMMIFLLLVGSVLWYGANLLGISGIPAFPLFAVASQTGTGVGGQVTTTGTTCPDNLLVPIYQKASYDDPTTGNVDTLVATNVYIYDMSAPSTAAITGSTSTSGYQTNGSISCGNQFNAFIGDGGTTYYYAKQSGTANGGAVYLSQKLKKSSAATMTFSNTTTFGASGVGVAIGTGETNSDVTVRIKAGSYYYGDGAFEICAVYPVSNFTKVSFGAQATPSPVDPTVSVVAGTTTDCYVVSGDKLYNSAFVELPVVIQAKSGVDPDTTTGTNITIYINDMSCHLKNGECTPSFWNLDTKADLGLAVVSQSNAITVR